MIKNVKIVSMVMILSYFSSFAFATTYYVSKSGNDTNSGTSWAAAWATISKVNSSISGGDTVFLGTGLWRNSQIHPPSGASFSDRTCYACSAFVKGICNIWGSDSVTNWTQYSGNVYRASWTGSGCYENAKCYTLGQDDFLLAWVDSIGAVNSSGKFYHDQTNNYLYAYVYDKGSGYDPDNYDMEASCKHVVDLNAKNQSHTTFWGMGFRWGKQGIVFFGRNEVAHPDSIFIDHCSLHGVSHKDGENASCVFFASPGGDTIAGGHYNRVRACSLGAVYNPSGNHASAICMYGETYFVVESCYVYRPLQVGVNFKNDVSGFIARNNIARFNTIKEVTSYGVVTYKYPYYDSIYGNVIIGDGVTERAVSIGGNSLSPGGYTAILNNTFYNCVDNTGLEAVGDGNGSPNSVLKYNVFFDSTTSSYFHIINTTAEAARWTIDSNVYYDNSTYRWQVQWSNKTLSEWRSQYGFDVYSDTGHAVVGINNPQGGDFSRPSSSQEMDVTYGGRTWTRYGAWQPDNGSDVGEKPQTETPESFILSQNYPNPFNSSTNIPFTVCGSRFRVDSPIHTTLKVYNILGKEVRTLVDEPKRPGNYEIIWDARDNQNQELPSGIYFYRLKTKQNVETRKMALLK